MHLQRDEPDIEADRELGRLAGTYQREAEFWYWKARIALARDNIATATGYADEALKRDQAHPESVALKVQLLLLSTRRGDRAKARKLAEDSAGISDPLDAWFSCVHAEGLFGVGVRTRTELNAKCPFPTPSGLRDQRPRDL